MGNITIINHSTFADYSAVMRVGSMIAGDEYSAIHDEDGNIVVKIKKQKDNSYLIVDAD